MQYPIRQYAGENGEVVEANFLDLLLIKNPNSPDTKTKKVRTKHNLWNEIYKLTKSSKHYKLITKKSS